MTVAYSGESRDAKDEALLHLDYAIDQLNLAVSMRGDVAEAWALLESMYGQKISLKPMLGMTLGSRSTDAIGKALDLAPDNPRVVLQKALSDLNTPREWGGSKTRAMEGFRRAAQLFEEVEESDPLQPDWGHVLALEYLARAYLDEGRLKEARAAVEKALELDPDNELIRLRVLPEFEKREANN